MLCIRIDFWNNEKRRYRVFPVPFHFASFTIQWEGKMHCRQWNCPVPGGIVRIRQAGLPDYDPSQRRAGWIHRSCIGKATGSRTRNE